MHGEVIFFPGTASSATPIEPADAAARSEAPNPLTNGRWRPFPSRFACFSLEPRTAAAIVAPVCDEAVRLAVAQAQRDSRREARAAFSQPSWKDSPMFAFPRFARSSFLLGGAQCAGVTGAR